MSDKNLTGYPSIDKPWLKYYNEDTKHFDKSKSIYQNFREIASKNMAQLVYVEQTTGKKVTYGELLSKADSLAKALIEKRIGNGSRVGLLTFYSDMEPAVIFAANKIGAIVKMVSPDLTGKELRKSISDLDILFVDSCFMFFEKVIRQVNILTVWNTDTLVFESERYCIYSELIYQKDGDIDRIFEECAEKPAIIIYSSGTTGVAKPIVHSNYSVLSAIEKMLNSDFPIGPQNYILKVIPSHIGLGSVTTMLTSILGQSTYISIKPEGFDRPPESTVKLLINYRTFVAENGLDPEKGLLFFASPLFSLVVFQCIELVDDLSFLNGVLLAGAKMHKEQLDALDAAFAEKGLSVPLCNGYGQNEMCGAISLNTVNHNKNGTAGYPVKGVDIRIIDEKTHLEKTYNEVGLIIEQSESSFMDTAHKLCMEIVRTDDISILESDKKSYKTAVLYAVAFLYENREKPDYNLMKLTLRALLANYRAEGF